MEIEDFLQRRQSSCAHVTGVNSGIYLRKMPFGGSSFMHKQLWNRSSLDFALFADCLAGISLAPARL